ncbi:MAG: shikimate kinase [Clostridia bacterium]|nr:shikimate kinase [Clostridia bacterium]
MNIVLTGFMASGKTVIARAIAEKYGYRFVDTDDMVADAAGRSINKIFECDGETVFRQMEREAIERASKLDGCVISTGGGVPLDKRNMTALRKRGVVVNLAPAFDVIAARIERAAATRPLLRDQSIEDIKKRFEARKLFYDDCDIRIKITDDKTPAQYAEEIVLICEKRYGMHE